MPSTLPCKSEDGACWGKLRLGDKKQGEKVTKRYQKNDYFDEDKESYGFNSLFNGNEDEYMKAHKYIDD